MDKKKLHILKNLNMIKREEALKASKEYFEGDELAAQVWVDKYSLKNKKGEILEKTPTEMHKRLSKEFHRIEKTYPNPLSEEDIFELLDKFKYVIPQGSPMAGIGNRYQLTSLGNCFVIPSAEDSYGGIMKTDQEQAQLMKRRGGCIEESTSIFVKDKGLIPVKNVLIGDFVLSKNISTGETEFNEILDKFEADVKIYEQVKITYLNGTEIETSSLHPIMSINKEGDYCYHTVKKGLNVDDFGITANGLNNGIFCNNKADINDIAWFVGAHLGDGTCDLRGVNNDIVRFRVVKSSESFISFYSQVLNKLTNSNIKYSISKRKDYKSKVWSYSLCNKNASIVCEKYLDNQTGKKVYTGRTPSFIKQNNLWIPFIAGLIDSDGHVKDSGTIELSICMKSVINDICNVLSLNGVDYHVTEHISKRLNENPLFRLSIYFRNEGFIDYVLDNLHNEERRLKILKVRKNDDKKAHYLFKKNLPLTKKEFTSLCSEVESFLETKTASNNFYNSYKYVKKVEKIGLAFFSGLKNEGIIDESFFNKISERVRVKKVEYDGDVKKRYIDIVVDKNHNYFAGKFGLVNIHNCGHDLSKLRPNGAFANNSVLGGIGGATLYMERFSNSTKEVSQGNRRGALMLTISIKHPDAELFIDKKMQKGKVTGANISVKITDEFMKAVKDDKDYLQIFPVDANELSVDFEPLQSAMMHGYFEYNELYSLGNGKYGKVVKARKLWQKITDNAWKSGEPGVIFIDTVQRESPADSYGSDWETVSTNPCGELPLCPDDSCRLIAINLYSYVKNPFSPTATFNFEVFANHVRKAQRLMDDLIDLELEKVTQIIDKIKTDPEQENIKSVELDLWRRIKKKIITGRRTGLGITGEGDMIAAMGLRYGTPAATDFAEEVHKVLATESYTSSIQMAKERGAFPMWDFQSENENPFIVRVLEVKKEMIPDYLKFGRRNIANLTIAPTGSLSILTQTTSGIEPVYKVSYIRRKKTDDIEKATFTDEVGDMWTEHKVFHHKFIDWFDVNWRDLELEWYAGVKPDLENLTEKELNKIIEQSPYYKATSNDIDYIGKVAMQGRVQRWVDHSISVTINMPETVKKDVVRDVYIKAYEVGCKGLTVYRDGSRSGVLVSKKENNNGDIKYNDAPKRHKTLECDIYHKTALKQDWTAVVGMLNGKPYEVFAFEQVRQSDFPKEITKGKLTKTKSRHYQLEGYRDNKRYVLDNIIDNLTDDEKTGTRKYSIQLRHGIKPEFIHQQIEKFANISSFDKMISRVLSNYVEDFGKCPSCGGKNLGMQDGCVTCYGCGFSKCS